MTVEILKERQIRCPQATHDLVTNGRDIAEFGDNSREENEAQERVVVPHLGIEQGNSSLAVANASSLAVHTSVGVDVSTGKDEIEGGLEYVLLKT